MVALDLRRGLGYKMHDAGLLLPQFVNFMQERRAESISTRLALEWAQRPSVQPAEWARRLCFVRGFARHRSATDSRTEIPPIGLLPHRSTRAKPHLYTEEEGDAPRAMAFLDELERLRGITARTRNQRLTAVHSFFRFAAFEVPSHAAQIQRVLAIPAKRFTRTLVPFLSRQEVDALLAAPDRRCWSGRRDHALLLLAVQTGLRLSDLTSLRREDLHDGVGAHVRVIGKGASRGFAADVAVGDAAARAAGPPCL